MKTAKRKWKTSDLPLGSEGVWHKQFVTTAYWYIGTLDKPWHINPALLCQVLQVIWDAIYEIPYKVKTDGAVYNLVSFLPHIPNILLTCHSFCARWSAAFVIGAHRLLRSPSLSSQHSFSPRTRRTLNTSSSPPRCLLVFNLFTRQGTFLVRWYAKGATKIAKCTRVLDQSVALWGSESAIWG